MLIAKISVGAIRQAWKLSSASNMLMKGYDGFSWAHIALNNDSFAHSTHVRNVSPWLLFGSRCSKEDGFGRNHWNFAHFQTDGLYFMFLNEVLVINCNG
jgi:hypothetical protein